MAKNSPLPSLPPSAPTGREEEADLMLKRTRVAPLVAWCGVVLFLGTLLSVPAAQMVARRVAGGAEVAGTPAAPMLLTRLPSGEQLRQIETRLREDSVVASSLRPRAQSVLTSFFGVGNEQVVIGRDGWLYYRQAVDYVTGPGFLDPVTMRRRTATGINEPNPLPAILQLHRQLAQRGIALVVMPVPVKASIYPEQLAPQYPATAETPQNVSFGSFRRTLEAAGVVVYDPTETLLRGKDLAGVPQFLRTDSHWTPGAVELVAQSLADLIRMFIDLPRRPAVPYTRRLLESAIPGDLVGLLGLPRDQRIYPPQRVRAHQVFLPSGELCETQENADILLLGDSFSGVYDGAAAGLAEQLSFCLQRPTDRIAIPNGGSFQARYQLGKQMWHGHDRLAGKKLVIYEFTSRDLLFGNWQVLDLPSAKTVSAPGATSPPSAAG